MPNKRVFKKLTGAKNYRPWSQWDEGDYVMGKLIEKIEEDRYGKPNYVLELEEGHFGNKEAAKKLVIGKDFVLNSATLLDNVMEKVEIGSVVRVEYLGREIMTKGAYKGKEAINLDIGVADADEDSAYMKKIDEDSDDL